MVNIFIFTVLVVVVASAVTGARLACASSVARPLPANIYSHAACTSAMAGWFTMVQWYTQLQPPPALAGLALLPVARLSHLAACWWLVAGLAAQLRHSGPQSSSIMWPQPYTATQLHSAL